MLYQQCVFFCQGLESQGLKSIPTAGIKNNFAATQNKKQPGHNNKDRLSINSSHGNGINKRRINRIRPEKNGDTQQLFPKQVRDLPQLPIKECSLLPSIMS